MSIVEPTNVGLNQNTHQKLKRLKEDGHFGEMADAYRCAIALALACGVVPDDNITSRSNIFNVGTVDPGKEIYTSIKAILPKSDIAIYKMAERLAEWGVNELSDKAKSGFLDFASLISEADAQLNIKK
jgi:hypothetical protein